VRVMLPWAEDVTLVDRVSQRNLGNFRRLHEEGLFELVLSRRKKRFDYCLRVSSLGKDVEIEDPYRFPPCLNDDDLYLFGEGSQEQAYRWMGSHPRVVEGVTGVLFTLWAPAARRVAVVGDFNGWDGRQHLMRKHPASGIWEIFIPAVAEFSHYKYEIVDANGELLPLKADPYAGSMQHPPETASRVLLKEDFTWSDQEWMARRATFNPYAEPVSVYEVHLGSWRRVPEQGNRFLSYREYADELIPYVQDLGFSHIQLMPISEFPFDGSWGYQPIGLYAPSIRFGNPDEFKDFVDRCHQAGLGVLLDWVPGHFPTDVHGLAQFDGSYLYEYMDRNKGFHPDWNTLIYNYGRCEVISFLLSNANYWLSEFHIDGLRVDAVASMLYLDYSREEGQWSPNQYGGREHLEAVELLRTVNARLYHNHPGVMMIAEESTAWPGVTKPVDGGGLGFGFKWNMGWMNDSLRYMSRDCIYRQYHQDEMTFSIMYAWSENFILPLSHDEVVHGKGSLINKMPGDDWQKFANLRAFYGYMWAHPGKKLLFMGGEFAQYNEWNHDSSLDWHLLSEHKHRGMQTLVRELNRLYCQTPALYQRDCESDGFQWLQLDNRQQSVFAWQRSGGDDAPIVVIANLTPQPHSDYRLGVPRAGEYYEVLNTDCGEFGGSNGYRNADQHSQSVPWDGQEQSITLNLPPLATLYLRYRPAAKSIQEGGV
jgi:1,4-alpha-glucan branching enzyme